MSSSLECFTWFVEPMSPYEGHKIGIKGILASEQSPFQKIDIIESFYYGRCLVLDGKMQCSQVDEFIYHEALIHPPMITHPNPKNIIIIGGGDLAALREILKYKGVEKVVLVDIDNRVVELCKQHLPSFHQNVFNDKRVQILNLDGRRYIEDSDEKFDVVIIDISEPLEGSPAYLLFTEEFYKVIEKHFSPNGILSVQSGTTNPCKLLSYTSVYKTLQQVFQKLSPYQAFIYAYATSWGFITASNSLNPAELDSTEIDKRLQELGINDLRFYDGLCHKALFSLPKFLRNALNQEGIIIRDDEPLFIP